jgi:hypothetical protein
MCRLDLNVDLQIDELYFWKLSKQNNKDFYDVAINMRKIVEFIGIIWPATPQVDIRYPVLNINSIMIYNTGGGGVPGPEAVKPLCTHKPRRMSSAAYGSKCCKWQQ